MKENLTELVAVIDKSGSMASVVNDAIGGFNTFLKAQKEAPGDAKMTAVLFDTTFSFYAANVDVKDVQPLTSRDYIPAGGTALYDAVGKTIDEVGKKLAAMKEEDRPSKVIFAILTDGEENQSQKYSGSKIKKMIQTQRDTYKWDFIFLAAGEGAFKEAGIMGMDLSKTMNFSNTGTNQTKSYNTLTSYVTASRRLNSEDYTAFSSSVNLQSAMNDTVDLSAVAAKISTTAIEEAKTATP
jgi:uncharacterized protein YegL